MRHSWLAVGPTVAIGVVAAMVSGFGHAGDPAFVFEQLHPTRFGPSQLAAIVMGTREPLPFGRGSPAVGVRCQAGGQGPRLNPWRCVVRYRSQRRITYRIHVAPTGHFQGADRTGVRVITGCCLRGIASRHG